jgi:predicted NUDIX family phosphoesterase
MDWRSAHRGIAINNGAEIRLSDNLSVGRHLHMREVRVAHHKIRGVRERKERERKEHLHPVA